MGSLGCTALQLAHLVARVSRNFDENRLTGAVFLNEAKAFHVVWVNGVLYKLTILNFPSYLVKTIPSYLNSWTFEASFPTATLKLHSFFNEIRIFQHILISSYLCFHSQF